MSIRSEISKSIKNNQIKDNNAAAKKKIASYNSVYKNAENNLKQMTKSENNALIRQTNEGIVSARSQYQKQLDYNAINQQLQQDKIAQRMASLGLSDSGVNLSGQTAAATARINADGAVNQRFNKAVSILKSNLQQAVAKNNQALKGDIADLNFKQGQAIAKIKADNLKSNASINAKLKSNSQTIVNKMISSIASAKDKGKAAKTIYSYKKAYGLSGTSVKRLLSMAGISLSDYGRWVKNRNYFDKK